MSVLVIFVFRLQYNKGGGNNTISNCGGVVYLDCYTFGSCINQVLQLWVLYDVFMGINGGHTKEIL